MTPLSPFYQALHIGLVAAAVTAGFGVGRAAPTPDPPAVEKATPIVVRSGKVTLPLTGLAVDLPQDPRKGATWALSGSWSFTDGGASFDARDVIDQKIDGKIVAGAWVHIGYFNAGDCGAVVKELDVPDRWTAERKLWGLHWHVAGGTWDFGNDLGKAPTVALCTSRPNRSSLLLYYFFVGDTAPLDQEARLAAVARITLFARVSGAWVKDRTAPVLPMKRPEIRRRGDIAAARKVRLVRSAMDVTLPDDGFAWLARPDAPDMSADFLDRMAPASPDISLEVIRVASATCEAILPTTGPDAPKRHTEPPPKGMPSGWRSLGTLALDADTLERVICRESSGRALLVGLLGTPVSAAEARDFAPFEALLAALAAASDTTPMP